MPAIHEGASVGNLVEAIRGQVAKGRDFAAKKVEDAKDRLEQAKKEAMEAAKREVEEAAARAAAEAKAAEEAAAEAKAQAEREKAEAKALAAAEKHKPWQYKPDLTPIDNMKDWIAHKKTGPRDLFKRWDKDGNGQISKDEFRERLPKSGFVIPEEEMEKLFVLYLRRRL